MAENAIVCNLQHIFAIFRCFTGSLVAKSLCIHVYSLNLRGVTPKLVKDWVQK